MQRQGQALRDLEKHLKRQDFIESELIAKSSAAQLGFIREMKHALKDLPRFSAQPKYWLTTHLVFSYLFAAKGSQFLLGSTL